MDQIIRDVLCNVKEYLKGLTGEDKFYADNSHTHTKSEVTDFKHNNSHHSEEYATTSALQSGLNGKSKVVFSRTLNSGDKIGSIKIDNNSTTDIYTYAPGTADPEMNGIKTKGISSKFAREDHVHPPDDNKSKVSFERTLSTGTEIGAITIDGNKTEIYCKTPPSTYSTNDISDPKAHNAIGSVTNASQSTINDKIDEKLQTKVDKVNGKSLIDDTDITKLGNIQEGATKTVIDSQLKSNSTNPVQNKVINNALNNKVNTSDIVNSISSGSTNPVQGGAIYTALNNKLNTSDVINSISSGSTKPVQGGAIYTALNGKVNTSDVSNSTSDIFSNSTKLIKGGAIYTALNNKIDKNDIDNSFLLNSTNPVQNSVIANKFINVDTDIANLGVSIGNLEDNVDNLQENAYKNSLRILIGRWETPNDNGEYGTRIVANRGQQGIYAKVLHNIPNFDISKMVLVMDIHGASYEFSSTKSDSNRKLTLQQDGTVKSGRLGIGTGIEVGEHVLIAFVRYGDNEVYPATAIKRIVAQ